MNSIIPYLDKHGLYLNPSQALCLLMERTDLILAINPWGSGTFRPNDNIIDVYQTYCRYLVRRKPSPLHIIYDDGHWNIYLVNLIPDARGNDYVYINCISTDDLIDIILACLEQNNSIQLIDKHRHQTYYVRRKH